MSLQIASLNSGSNGNCYYIGNHTEAVLIDAGISCREIEKRLCDCSLDITKIKAVFVSHEHTDHLKGVSKLANKYKLPVYITSKTGTAGLHFIKQLSKSFVADVPIFIGDLSITAFSKKHDAADPHSFIISYKNITVGVMTDIGLVCKNVIRYFKQCHAVFLESNYDEDMLWAGKYPLFLKQRISGGEGHLSNRQAVELFLHHKPSFMSHLILSHLSKDNNSPQKAMDAFFPHAGQTKVVVASRYKPTEVFTIPEALNKKEGATAIGKLVQLNLFGN
ncbi:MAG: MBL fold metallo-hydrolase [Niabella sp.]